MKLKHAVPLALAAAMGALFIQPQIVSSDFSARDPGVRGGSPTPEARYPG